MDTIYRMHRLKTILNGVWLDPIYSQSEFRSSYTWLGVYYVSDINSKKSHLNPDLVLLQLLRLIFITLTTYKYLLTSLIIMMTIQACAEL